MDAIEAIFTRRSVDQVRADPVPRGVVEQLLAAASQAPNHYRVRPWRFFVLQGTALEQLGQVMADALQRRSPEAGPDALQKERQKALRAPLMIVATLDTPGDVRSIPAENHSAVAAAVQNLLLAAHALGLGAKWRTGPAAYDEGVRQFFGLGPGQEIIAMLYIGYPLHPPAPFERGSYDDRTTWLD